MTGAGSAGAMAGEGGETPSLSVRVIRATDCAGTFVFALEAALVAIGAGFDPIGVLVFAFVGSVGGGIARDLLLRLQPAAITGPLYALIALSAAAAAWSLGPHADMPALTLKALDAAGLALFAVAGTEKALDTGIHPVPAIFVGALGAVGGGVMCDVLLNEPPRILHTDIYATAALLAAGIVVCGRRLGFGPRSVALVAGLACFALRMSAVLLGWQLPGATS